MPLIPSLAPRPALTEDEVRRGLRAFTIEGAATMGLGSITGSGFLAAYALILGANNFQIGLLAALPFLAMPLQVATVGIVEQFRRRKLIAVPAWLAAQALWFPIAVIPFLAGVPSAGAVSMLLGFVALRSVLAAVQNPAWNSWLRDLVPQQVMGSVFANRLRYANLAAMGFGLGAALFVDFWRNRNTPEAAVYGYTIALLFGAAFLGITSVLYRLRMPEPAMETPIGAERQGIFSSLAEPFKDRDYRPMLVFQFFWALALNLATPFLAVYMLQRIGLPVSAVLGFSVLSQAINVVFLRVWGPLVDRVGNKAVLSVSASLYLLVILGWTFTTMPERYFLTIPLLVVLHMLAGAASAGATLTTGTIGLKLAPSGKATSYVAAVSVVANLGAGIGPLLGGRLADFFSVRELSVNFSWTDPTRTIGFQTLHMTGFDFLFGITFLMGLLTLNMLARVREQGEAGREVVLEALFAPAHRATDPMSSVPGLGLITQFPFGYARLVPGLDVAFGVTAYQIAETTRLAANAAALGRAGTREGVRHVRDAVRGLLKVGQHAEGQMTEFARHAARGAMLTTGSAALDVTRRTRSAVQGVVEAVGHIGGEAENVLYAAIYGAVQGASESKENVKAAVESVMDVVGEIAEVAGISHARAKEIASKATQQAMRDHDVSADDAGQIQDEREKARFEQ